MAETPTIASTEEQTALLREMRDDLREIKEAFAQIATAVGGFAQMFPGGGGLPFGGFGGGNGGR